MYGETFDLEYFCIICRTFFFLSNWGSEYFHRDPHPRLKSNGRSLTARKVVGKFEFGSM